MLDAQTRQERIDPEFRFRRGKARSGMCEQEWEKVLIINNLGSKFTREAPTAPPLPPTRPFNFPVCHVFNFIFVFPLPRSSPPQNATLPAMLYFQHFLTSPSPVHSPPLTSPRPSSWLLSGPSPFPLLPPPFHAPPPLIRSIVPLTLATSTLSDSLHHTTTSIPPFHSCRLSEPQQS